MITIGDYLKHKQRAGNKNFGASSVDIINITEDTYTAKGIYKDSPIKKIKREISKKASMANKRLKRLEENGLTKLPAYQEWVTNGGGVKFSVKGKTYNELQKELSRVNRFINSKTSLVREANKHLKDIAKMTGINYDSVKQLPKLTETFFELSSKVEQYLRNVEGSASAIGYQKIWTVINEYVESEQIALDSSRLDMNKVLDSIIDISKYDIKDGHLEVKFKGWIDVPNKIKNDVK